MTISPDLRTEIQQFKDQGVQIVATRPTASITYWQVDMTRPTLILLGNEGAGLSSELTAMADISIKIPLAAGVESLNVAITAALILYEARRQREV
jgi:TrmH family RNA methyltransferase